MASNVLTTSNIADDEKNQRLDMESAEEMSEFQLKLRLEIMKIRQRVLALALDHHGVHKAQKQSEDALMKTERAATLLRAEFENHKLQSHDAICQSRATIEDYCKKIEDADQNHQLELNAFHQRLDDMKKLCEQSRLAQESQTLEIQKMQQLVTSLSQQLSERAFHLQAFTISMEAMRYVPKNSESHDRQVENFIKSNYLS
jgi:hypothetical protein